MRRVDQLISEIKELRQQATYKSALRVFQLLDNNKNLFLEKIESDTFRFFLTGFSELSEASAATSQSPSFKREYDKLFETLLFHLNRV